MGVPKFFRCISERYPCLSELVKEFQTPDFDNFYLDMNGIIHLCSHPNDFDPHFVILEEKIFASIFHYIEVLINIIKPRKLIFMAVDGVAPRAKMNQQRARRFRTAKAAEISEKEALRKGEKPLPKERFDSNCITPGTVFMDRLHSQLKYFITSKISTDPVWQSCKVILSGHQTPGEGEHKIMDYIRYLKTLPDYDENTRHCLYGLDADLIMLGLCTHEPHFCILREKVQFNKHQNKRIMSPDETDFYLLHLSLLREYLDLEFQDLKETLPFQYNLENIIDDWVLMGFLVGNDFIPNLPDLHINKGAFPILYKAYKEVLPTLDGYLNENGYLILPRFQQFMEKMAAHDLETFEDTYANLAFLEEKTGKSFFFDHAKGNVKKSSELDELIKATEEFLDFSEEDSFEEEVEENDENDTFLWEFCQHKKNYYSQKLDYRKVTPEVLKSQAEGYVRAIQWILHYYYQGCQSWSWYYPHHYAPYISDIRDFKDLKLDFEMGEPFLPFVQLLAVLPAASKDLLPEAYRHLMTSPNSPIKDFYPEDFETDLNGKEHDWEAVVLIPFIDEKRLLEATEPCNEKLTPEERRRNQHGPMHIYMYTKQNLGVYKAVEYFPSLSANHASVKDVFREEIAVEKCDLKYRLRSGIGSDVLYLGFPTLKHIPHTACLKASKIKVFDYPSRGENMILTLTKREFPPLDVLAKTTLGKIILINWPYLSQSRAVAVSNMDGRFYLAEHGGVVYEPFSKRRQRQWIKEGEDIATHYAQRLGVIVGPIEYMVHVLTFEGRKYLFEPMGKVTNEIIWSTTETLCAIQVIVQDVDFHDSLFCAYSDLRSAFPVNSVVFMLGQPHFGSKGRILDSKDGYKNGRLKVELEIVSDPPVYESLIKADSTTPYLPCRVAALKVGISSRLFCRITGNILVSMTNDENSRNSESKINIGLNLKFCKKNEEIPGYTKKKNDNWLYSTKTVAVVSAYVEKFSRVIEFLSSNQDTSVFFVQDIFPGPNGVTEMKEMVAWIKEQDFNKVERLKCGTNLLDSQTVAKIEEIVERTPKQTILRQIQIKPQFLYKSDLVLGNIPPVKSAKHSLLDRVVSIRSSYTVPTGLRGIIIGIHPAPLEADYLYDVLFDTPFPGGMKLYSSETKVFRMSWISFLNVTDAYRQSHRSVTVERTTAALTPANNVSLRPCYQEPKTSAFAQWIQRPSVKGGNDQFKIIWSSLQASKPQEDALKEVLKIEKKPKTDIEEPVRSFFEKITKATKDGYWTSEMTIKDCWKAPEKTMIDNWRTTAKAPIPFVENPPPDNRYYPELFSFYQKKGLGYPKFRYLYVEGGKVIAQVRFRDGRVYSGLPCEDKESARESVSLQTLGALGEITLNNEILLQKEMERERKLLESQTRLSSALTKPKGVTQNRPPKSNQRPMNRMPPLLPDPPSQWVGLSRHSKTQGYQTRSAEENFFPFPKKDVQENPQVSSNSRREKLNASALEFVPLQAITGKRNFGTIATIQSPKQVTEVQKKAEVVPTFFNTTATSSSTVKPRRRPKIAAKLNLDPNLY